MFKISLNQQPPRAERKGKKFLHLAITSLLAILLNSCIGVSLDIQMNRDGSGRLTMEYRISNMINSIGMLDGNQSMIPVPVSRNDWERSAEKLSGVKLVSYSGRENEHDNLIRVVIDFPNPESLAALLDPSGETVSITANSLNMILLDEPDSQYDDNIISLMRPFFSEYSITVNFNAHVNSALTVTDGRGNTRSAPARAIITQPGRRVSLSIGTMDLLEIPEGLGVRIAW